MFCFLKEYDTVYMTFFLIQVDFYNFEYDGEKT